MALLSQVAAGDEAPFVVPESLAPSAIDCQPLWRALTSTCTPCAMLQQVLQRALDASLVMCPA